MLHWMMMPMTMTLDMLGLGLCSPLGFCAALGDCHLLHHNLILVDHAA